MGQFNIKDDALIARLRLLAERRQTTGTDALRQAVDEALARDEAALAERAARRRAAMEKAVEQARGLFPKDWDGRHDDLYDENGLPA